MHSEIKPDPTSESLVAASYTDGAPSVLKGPLRTFPGPATVHELFEARVCQYPGEGRVRFLDQAVSLVQLNARANQVARWLREHGVGHGDLVGICFEPCVDLVVALLASLKTGAAFLPLDTAHPRERSEFVLSDARARVVLCNDTSAHYCADVSARVLNLDVSHQAISDQPGDNLDIDYRADDVIYVMYTSGSTGLPKGAILTHAGIRNRLLWGIDEYELGSGASVLFKTPISFDVCIWEIFAPLLSGADLVIAEPGAHRDIPRLIELIDRHEITHADFVPSMMSVFINELPPLACASLRVITCAGEALSASLLDRIFSRLRVRIYNLYGPTEASLAVTWWSCTQTPIDREVPIGRPMANIELRVLDERGCAVPMGQPGELYIGGAAPGRGYVNRPEKTAASFVADRCSGAGILYRTGDLVRVRQDGALVFLGRIDQQVKVRGVRIELEEIQAQLEKLPLVRETIVIVKDFGADDQRLVAYLTLREPLSSDDDPRRLSLHEQLRSDLQKSLPAGLIPSHFIVLNALPLTSNGKADRSALSALPVPHAPLLTPRAESRTEIQARLAAAWQEVLGINNVQPDSDFFSLGGHSLLAVKVISLLRPHFPLSISDLFEQRNIQALACLIESRTTPQATVDSHMSAC